MKLRTEKRKEKIKSDLPGYNFVEIWSHEWAELKKQPHVKLWLSKQDISEPLEPRDSLFGGRTNALKLFHECSVDEKIKYIDYTSLYLYIQKYGIYPIGHPTIITDNFDLNFKYFGLIKCKILPKRGLFIPPLPTRINGKLLFPL